MLSCTKQKLQQTDKCNQQINAHVNYTTQCIYFHMECNYASSLDVHVYPPQVTMFKDIARIVKAVPVPLYLIVAHSTKL